MESYKMRIMTIHVRNFKVSELILEISFLPNIPHITYLFLAAVLSHEFLPRPKPAEVQASFLWQLCPTNLSGLDNSPNIVFDFDTLILDAPNLEFGRPVACTSAPWGVILAP